MLIFKNILKIFVVLGCVLVPVKFEISVVQVGKSLKVTIPVEIAKYLELKKGDTVQMWADDHRVILEKKGPE